MFAFLNRWNDTMAMQLEARPVEVAQQALARQEWGAGKHRADGSLLRARGKSFELN